MGCWDWWLRSLDDARDKFRILAAAREKCAAALSAQGCARPDESTCSFENAKRYVPLEDPQS